MPSQNTDLLKNLNPAQRQAVEQIFGPVLVLAGPGTGKTHLLTTRIGHILQKTDSYPSNILCLTFTDSAAVEMRNRLQKKIGNDAYKIQISTFHGFCQNIMDQNPDIFEKKLADKVIADDLQKALLFRSSLRTRTWKYFRPIHDEFSQQRNFLSAIDSLKREHIDVEKLRSFIPEEKERLMNDPSNFYKKKYKEFEAGDMKPAAEIKIDRKMEKLSEFCDLWEIYNELMDKERLYDFNDQINWVVEALQTNEELRYDLQEQFQWILVDEYQDTNTSQNQILWSLCEGVEKPNIFAVGDDDQSIYRFQGASIANIESFREKFADRKEVTLTQNYRSYQPILDAAYGVVQNNTARANKEKKLVAVRDIKSEELSANARDDGIIGVRNDNSCVNLSIFGSPYGELQWLIQSIKKAQEQGVKTAEIAILVRRNSEVLHYARELPKLGIDVSATLGENIFEHESVSWLLWMLEVFQNPKDDEILLTLLHAPFWNIDPHVLLQLSLDVREKKISIVEMMLGDLSASARDDGIMDAQDDNERDSLEKWFEFFVRTRQNYQHLRPAALCEKLLYESGLANFVQERKSVEAWQNIRRFIDWIRESSFAEASANRADLALQEILDRAALHQELDIPIRPDPLPPNPKAVRIMTAHKSKGQEFEVVFLPGLHDKKWGNPKIFSGIPLPELVHQTVSKEDGNEEERRLFFVALTRAKNKLHLSYSCNDLSGRDKTPSQFIHEIPEDILHTEDKSEQSSIDKLLPVFLQHQEKTFTNQEKALLQNHVKNFVWSATSLQNYLDCPRRFLYQQLYKFPRRPLAIMAQGVALHQALERYLRLTGSDRTYKKLEEEYTHALEGQNTDKHLFEQLLFEGKNILKRYFDEKLQTISKSHPHGYLLEFNFGPLHPEVDGIRITGKMDKVVFENDKKTMTTIVDYKSGKPRPITKGERLWRQLVFYDILAKYTKDLGWKATSCELEFLTPDNNGKLLTKKLEVTSEDREQVIAELKEVSEKVLNFDFPAIENPKNDPDIEYWNNFGS